MRPAGAVYRAGPGRRSRRPKIHFVEESLEGWYTDPYARHEARWMSESTPTDLVRDGEVEGHDPVPDGPFIVIPESVGEDPRLNGGQDLRRADDAERERVYGSKRAMRRALDVIDQHSIN